ncbi:MAG: hypothetical protein C4K49_10780 [Candidatus Thorarchaeota archaeon]|nr:MAG: hypothetical protein C4K49_10780 [Candidatus Thorarchaeota archaeon]
MKQGFFEQLGLEVTKTSRPSSSRSGPPRRSSNLTKKENETCEDCGLYKTCQSPKMPPTGKGEKGILIVAEAPGKTEDEEGIQLIGKSGHYLRTALEDLGADLDRDFWKTNAVICRPPDNRTPTPKELRICRENLLNTIEVYQPKVVVLIGQPAFDSYLGPRLVGRIKNVPYSSWVGMTIPDQETGRWICPLYHPSYLLRLQNEGRRDREEQEDKVLAAMYRRQLQRIIDLADEPVPTLDYGDIQTTDDEATAIEWIKAEMAEQPRWLTFDYETTGLKPHRAGHGIRVVSFCDGVKTRAFKNTMETGKWWAKLLQSCDENHTGVIAHHMSFEEMWSMEILGTKLDMKCRWDTMLGAHIIDNKRSCGLKFLVYTKFGVLGYDQDVDYYIETKKQGEDNDSCNSFNRIDEADQKKLLRYGAEDSFFTYKIFLDQYETFKKDPHTGRGAAFFFESVGSLARMQQNGVCVDMDELKSVKTKITRRLECIKDRIDSSPEVKKWDGLTAFNFKSGPQLSHLLYDIMGIEVKKKTGLDKASTDEEALEKIDADIPMVHDIVDYRHWSKVLTTYLGQYEREVMNGLLHANFGLGNVDTFRSSSFDPNLQNVPKRDEQVKNLIRSIIRPRPGHRIIEYDYKALEVSIAGCVFRDPNWLSYCRDTSKDMHRDTAIEILYLTDEYGMPWEGIEKKIAKQVRQASKNGFVFPSVYGSSGKSAAAGMWEQLPDDIKRHLRVHIGIKDLEGFTKRMIAYEKDYWGVRYPIYDKNRRDLFKSYEKKGYIEQVTGFRCYGPMSFMQVVNYPVQGPASHVKLKTLSEVSQRIVDEKKDILPIMEIHDSMLFDVNPDDEAWLDETVRYHGMEKVAQDWKWIIVPLLLEKERSEVDGTWAVMNGCGYLGGGRE